VDVDPKGGLSTVDVMIPDGAACLTVCQSACNHAGKSIAVKHKRIMATKQISFGDWQVSLAPIRGDGVVVVTPLPGKPGNIHYGLPVDRPRYEPTPQELDITIKHWRRCHKFITNHA